MLGGPHLQTTVAVAIAVLGALTHPPPAPATACTPPAAAAPQAAIAVVDGYRGDQLANAATIIRTGTALGVQPDAPVLAVMTAMGESGLHDLPHGDGAINPDGSIADSIGLFQQQHWWGSRTERMDPATAATGFYRHLLQVQHWQTMTPTAAAHAVQGNADPDYYAPYYRPALDVVAHLAAHPEWCPRAQPAEVAGGPATTDPWGFRDTVAEVNNTFLGDLERQGATLPESPDTG